VKLCLENVQIIVGFPRVKCIKHHCSKRKRFRMLPGSNNDNCLLCHALMVVCPGG